MYTKKVLTAAIFVGILFFIVGCTTPPVVLHQHSMNEIISDLSYAKDPRTGLCFAIYAGGYGLATVPCEAIPTELLTIAEVK